MPEHVKPPPPSPNFPSNNDSPPSNDNLNDTNYQSASISPSPTPHVSNSFVTSSSSSIPPSSLSSFPPLTIILARWIVPVDTDGPRSTARVIDRGAVVIRNHSIIDIGTIDTIKERYMGGKGVEVVDLSKRHVLVPGFINCHTHSSMSLLRGYADDLPLDEWLKDFIWPTEGRMLGEEFVYEGACIAAYEGLKNGTTMINDMYFLPKASIPAFREAGMRCVTGKAILDLGVGGMEKQFDEAISLIKELLSSSNNSTPADHRDRLIRPSFTPHSLYTVASSWHSKGIQEINELVKGGETNGEEGMSATNPSNPSSFSVDNHIVYHTHLNETEREILEYGGREGESALVSLEKAGALTPSLVLAHCVHLSEGEVGLLAKHKVNVCHCPRSNMKLASGFCPVWRLMGAGINVCIGTDGSSSNNSLDMLSEMQWAALLAKGVSGDSGAVDDFTALRMATRNGARALGRLHDLGSLEVGKLADIVAVDLVGEDGAGHPVYDPISHLIYTTHRKVTDVWIDGYRVVQDSSVKTLVLDWTRIEEIIKKMTKIRGELFAARANKRQ